jgi:cardiolipin synthase
MRGVEIDVVLPRKNNLPFVAWACMGQLRPLLSHGVNVWFTNGPFDHSKIAVIDRVWTLLGSPNWDPRSLRLNFEFAMECYDRSLANRMADWVAERVARAELWTLQDHDDRSWPRKLRDGVFRLGSPYL